MLKNNCLSQSTKQHQRIKLKGHGTGWNRAFWKMKQSLIMAQKLKKKTVYPHYEKVSMFDTKMKVMNWKIVKKGHCQESRRNNQQYKKKTV